MATWPPTDTPRRGDMVYGISRSDMHTHHTIPAIAILLPHTPNKRTYNIPHARHTSKGGRRKLQSGVRMKRARRAAEYGQYSTT